MSGRVYEVPKTWITIMPDQRTLMIAACNDDPIVFAKALKPPFTIVGISAAYRDEGKLEKIRILESPRESPQRAAIGRTIATRAERVAIEREFDRQKLSLRAENQHKEKLNHALMATSADPAVKTRADAIIAKNEIDVRLAEVRAAVLAAKTKAYQSKIYDPNFRASEKEFERLKLESQGAQARIGFLTKAEKDRNRLNDGREPARRDERLAAFARIAQELLDPPVFQSIWDRVNEAFTSSDGVET